MTFFEEVQSDRIERLKQLYRLIRRYKQVDISRIKELMDLKHATCVRLIEELLQYQLIQESGVGVSSGGRKPKLYSINPRKAYLVGIELSNLYTTVLLMDLELNILEERKLKMGEVFIPELVFDFIIQSIQQLLTSNELQRNQLVGVGIGILTRIDDSTGRIKKREYSAFKEWSDIDIQGQLAEQLGLPVVVHSATNLAALVEYRKNYWNEEDNLLFVANDLIIRSASMINGQMLYKNSEMTESFGHMTVDLQGEKCFCGMYGCLDTISSLPAIRTEIIKRVKMGYSSSLTEAFDSIDDINYYHILQGIEEQDQLCLDVVDRASYYLGIGLSNLILQLRPKTVIIGGTLGSRSIVVTRVREVVQERLEYFTEIKYEIKSASSSFNTVAQGAGCMVLDLEIGETIF